jgi:hypothetical protein
MTRWVVCFRDLLPEEKEASDYLSETLLRYILRETCAPGFRHCFAYTQAPGGYLVVDARANGMDAAVISEEMLPVLLAPVTCAAHGLQWFRRGWHPRGLLTCVTVIKHLLGIRAWWVITPKQLYGYLQRRTV